MMSVYVDLLRRNRDMRMIWLAGLISLIGDWFSFVVLLAMISKYNPENPGLAVSVLFLARFIPSLIFTPAAGVLLDRFNRRNLLVWSNYTRAAVGVLYLFALTDASQQWLIYLGTILQAILATVYEPGQAALITNVCDGEDLINGNTLINATWSAALAIGGAVGGVVAAAFGVSAALTIDIGTFVIAGLLIANVRSYVHHAGANKHEDTSLTEGLRYIKSQPSTLATLLVKFGGSLGNVDTAMTIFATQIFILGEDGLVSVGLLYTAFGIGAVLGPIVTNRLSNGSDASLRWWILIGFIAQAAGWLILGWAGVIAVVCLGLILRGTGGSVNWTYSSILLQRTTPDLYRGRVFAMDMVFYTLATIFATLMQGGLIDALGEENIGTVALLTASLSILPVIGWGWAIRRWSQQSTASMES